MKLQVVKDAMEGGLRVGALVHEKTGTVCRVEVVTVDGDRLLAVAEADDKERKLFVAGARVRVELPRVGTIVHAAGEVAEVRPAAKGLEIELVCPNGADERQRRAAARVSAECRLRMQAGGTWQETATVNVSAGGVLVAKGGSCQVGDLIDVEIDLEEGVIRCQAEVLRRGVKSGGFTSRVNAALRFVGLSDADREWIALYVLAVQAKEKATARARR